MLPQLKVVTAYSMNQKSQNRRSRSFDFQTTLISNGKNDNKKISFDETGAELRIGDRLLAIAGSTAA
jgi:exopolysaccharide biosynthesis protein